MNKDKQKKVLRYTLYGIACIAAGAYGLTIPGLPNKFGSEWIYGWMPFAPWYLLFLGNILVKFISQKKKEKTDEPKKEQTDKPRSPFRSRLARALLSVVAGGLILFMIAVVATIFFSQDPIARNRYINSPDGNNKAVAISYKYGNSWVDAWAEKVWGEQGRLSGEHVEERIYPVKALLFYEKDKGANISPCDFDVAFNWVDNNTLEITRIDKYKGEVTVEYLKW